MKWVCRIGLLLCSIGSLGKSFAQYYYYNARYYEPAIIFEIGAGAGVMNALTDLGGRKGPGKNFIKDLEWQHVKPCAGIFVLAFYKTAIGLRVQVDIGSVAAADHTLKNVSSSTFGRYERNLSFSSPVTDLQLAIEIHPLFFRDYGYKDPPVLSPYFILGAGYFNFDPRAKLDGKLYALRPLRTEGQGFAEYPDRKPYRSSQINFAGGFGLRWEISPRFCSRFEINHRTLMTDYLDDVSTSYIDDKLFSHYLPSQLAATARKLHNRKTEIHPGSTSYPGEQRGNPDNNDAYFTIQFKLGITIGREKR